MPGAHTTLVERFLFPAPSVNNGRLAKMLDGKTVLITGASYGIGEALAYKLSRPGVRLILVARTKEKLEELKKKIEDKGGTAIIYVCDLSKQDEVQLLAQYLLSLQGAIDMVISNAGKSIRRPIYESLNRFHDFTRLMGVNYFGPLQLILALTPVLERNKGVIINVSAINVLLAPPPYWAAYQSSKTAFDQWFRCAAPELRARGITTSSVYLPLVRTRMIAPTAAYDRMPAMSAENAARMVLKAIITKKRRIAPWWLFGGIWASLLFGSIWEKLSERYIRKKIEY